MQRDSFWGQIPSLVQDCIIAWLLGCWGGGCSKQEMKPGDKNCSLCLSGSELSNFYFPVYFIIIILFIQRNGLLLAYHHVWRVITETSGIAHFILIGRAWLTVVSKWFCTLIQHAPVMCLQPDQLLPPPWEVFVYLLIPPNFDTVWSCDLVNPWCKTVVSKYLRETGWWGIRTNCALGQTQYLILSRAYKVILTLFLIAMFISVCMCVCAQDRSLDVGSMSKTPPTRRGIKFEVGAQLEARDSLKNWWVMALLISSHLSLFTLS